MFKREFTTIKTYERLDSHPKSVAYKKKQLLSRYITKKQKLSKDLQVKIQYMKQFSTPSERIINNFVRVFRKYVPYLPLVEKKQVTTFYNNFQDIQLSKIKSKDLKRMVLFFLNFLKHFIHEKTDIILKPFRDIDVNVLQLMKQYQSNAYFENKYNMFSYPLHLSFDFKQMVGNTSMSCRYQHTDSPCIPHCLKFLQYGYDGLIQMQMFINNDILSNVNNVKQYKEWVYSTKIIQRNVFDNNIIKTLTKIGRFDILSECHNV